MGRWGGLRGWGGGGGERSPDAQKGPSLLTLISFISFHLFFHGICFWIYSCVPYLITCGSLSIAQPIYHIKDENISYEWCFFSMHSF